MPVPRSSSHPIYEHRTTPLDDSAEEAASAALALIEGALLLGRVSGQRNHLAHAKRAALALFAAPPANGGTRPRTF